MMKPASLHPILWTAQPEATIQFYTGLLSFTLRERNDGWGWAALQKDEVEIMIAKPNEHIPFNKPGFTGSFYFNTENVDQWWEALKDKVTICYEINNFDWQMREFAIYDNNGYQLQFGQAIKEP